MIYYSSYHLNTYRTTPYFEAHLPDGYPIGLVLQSCRRFTKLPPRLRELSSLAKQWAKVNKLPIVKAMAEWYDDQGYEINPNTGDRLTDAEIDSLWGNNQPPRIFVDLPNDIRFSDPKTWKEPKIVETTTISLPSRGVLEAAIESHGFARTADEYGLTEDELLSIIE